MLEPVLSIRNQVSKYEILSGSSHMENSAPEAVRLSPKAAKSPEARRSQSRAAWPEDAAWGAQQQAAYREASGTGI